MADDTIASALESTLCFGCLSLKTSVKLTNFYRVIILGIFGNYYIIFCCFKVHIKLLSLEIKLASCSCGGQSFFFGFPKWEGRDCPAV